MDFVKINPGLKNGLRQAFTITIASRIFFLTYDERSRQIIWNMFIDDAETKGEVEKLLRNYLTNQ